MKKLFTAIFILLCSVVFGQNGTPLYPITQNIGSTSALLDIKGGARVGGAFVLGHYADTTAANAVPYVKNFANGLITTDTNLLWIRSYNAQQWYFVPNTGNPATGDTLYWRVGGNALIPMQQQGIYTGLGSKDSTPLFFITNYQRRLVIPPNGVNRSAGTANKCLVIDTVTKFMYYTDCGTGGSTPTLQQVLTAGPDLTTSHLIDGGGNDIEFDNFVNYSIGVSGTNSGIALDARKSGGRKSAIAVLPDTLKISPGLGNITIDSLNYTLSTTGKKIMLRDTATGLVQNIDPALLGGSTAISALTAATGTNSIDNGAYKQEWQWNSLAGTNGFKLSSNSTAAVDGQRFAFISSTGANASSTVTTTALTVSNDHTGTSSTNVAGYFASNDGTNNYAIIVPGGGGSVGIGTSTPASILHTVGTVRHETLGTASGDTTANKPVGINSSGDIIPMTYWPGGGGSGVTTMGAIGSSPNANGATISGSTLNLEPASASFGGVVTTGTQTIAGNKTFTGVSVFGSPTALVGNFQVGGTIWISGSPGYTYYAVHDGTNQAVLAPTFMTFTGLGSGSIGYASGVMNIQGNATYSTVVNDNSADVDFRLEGDGDANLIFADAGNDKVGIGTASPTTKLHVAGRFAATQGADVASAAGAITLGTDGNTFEITGTAAITLISNAGWVNGSEINLIFTSTATLTDGTANSGTDIGMELAGNANFTASADDVLTLVLCEIGGVQRWREKSRSVN